MNTKQYRRHQLSKVDALQSTSGRVWNWSALVICAACVVTLAYGCSDDSTSGHALRCEAGTTICGHSCCDATCCDGVCIDTTSSMGNCGACGVACDTDEVCVESSCKPMTDACGDSKVWCRTTCVDTMSDDDNCGTCGNACGALESCVGGKCKPECLDSWVYCENDNKCANLTTDAEHCGSCGHVCGGNMYCANGACVCPAGTSNCDGDESNGCETPSLQCGQVGQCADESKVCGDVCCDATCCNGAVCVDLTSNPLHCGDCATPCETTQRCEGGVCVDDIAGCDKESDTPCFGTCADLKTSVDHCGGGGIACSTDEECVDGECQDAGVTECDRVGYKACYGTCTNIYSDVNHCGDCRVVCGEKERCRLGKCEPDPAAFCTTTEKYCFGSCFDVLSDVERCGSCTTKCREGEVCIDGLCLEDCGEKERCGNGCFDLKRDIDNCGACGVGCLAGEACVDGACVCSEGYFDCDGKAENGCESTTACSCKPGEKRKCWRGSEETRNKGICRDGEQTCDATGAFWGSCTGGVYPSLVSCDVAGNLNGKDNDCDGVVDTACRSTCDLEAGEKSYIGCEYWTAYLYNLYSDNHTVVMSNPSDTLTTKVYIYNKSGFENATQAPLYTLSIEPKGVVVQQINPKGKNMCISTSQMPMAYRIRADHPITAYQFNSWAAASTNSNDASLLIPSLSLGKEYIVITYESQTGGEQDAAHTSYFTVVATEPGKTHVTVKTTAPIVKSGHFNNLGGHELYAGPNIEAMKAGDTRVFELDRFDVLTLNAPPQRVEQTGTTVNASKNVAVFGGSRSSYIPDQSVGCCRDHLEEQLFPLHSWGSHYYAARTYSKGSSGDFYRILAQKDGTRVTIVPAVVDPSTFTLNAGEFKQFEARDGFEIKANHPISVGQFMPSNYYAKTSNGDPSFLLTVPVEQYRKDYAFSVPESYSENYVTFIAPKSSEVRLDGNVVEMTDFTDIGKTGYAYGYRELKSGTHRVVATEPIGLYGYGSKGISSYGYPIGLDLKVINLN